MTRRRWYTALLTASLLLSIAAAGCAPVVDPSSVIAATPPGVPASAAQVYAAIAPSVAFIDTPAGTGSGLLTRIGNDDYIVTNAHVVWPFSQVRVVFPNREEHPAVPVVADDPLVDLAVLGPLQTTLPPIDLTHAGDPQPGDPVYLIGYPGEGELFPAPAITQGILSRTRVWDAVDSLRYFQTDAAGAGGQSGGVLVSSQGRVAGISGMLFSDVFVLAASSHDVADRLREMLAEVAEGPDAEPHQDPSRRVRQELDSLWDTHGYFVHPIRGDRLEITAASSSDLALSLFDAGPEELAFADVTFDGAETVSTTVNIDAPHVVVVEQFLPGPATYQLRSSHALEPITDLEDGMPATPGETIVGGLDYPSDIDWFVVSLGAGDVLTVSVDAVHIDPVVSVGPRNESADAYFEDDDSGRGMLGSNASLAYQVERSGDHLIVVRSFSTDDMGGYLLTIGSTQNIEFE